MQHRLPGNPHNTMSSKKSSAGRLKSSRHWTVSHWPLITGWKKEKRIINVELKSESNLFCNRLRSSEKVHYECFALGELFSKVCRLCSCQLDLSSLDHTAQHFCRNHTRADRAKETQPFWIAMSQWGMVMLLPACITVHASEQECPCTSV